MAHVPSPMTVAAHLGIDLREYDCRIRTFIPHYDEMLDAAAAALTRTQRSIGTIVDLGTGTGALASRCLARIRGARIIGLDRDPDILGVAARRLRGRLRAIEGDFLDMDLPRCDAITASLALHHVSTARAKRRFYRRAHAAVRRGGVVVSADCFLPAAAALRTDAFRQWRTHLERAYSTADARRFLAAWAKEDTYFELTAELRMLKQAGFDADVAWRRGTFAVVVAQK